jgi:predicted  nucleic acid-binding Zn-ribbon protein
VTVADLEVLLALQDLDMVIDQQRHQRAQLPQRAELARIESEAAELRPAIDAVTASRDALAARQLDAETELAATEQRADAVSRRMYSGEISASRELQAMSHDVDSLKARASTLEDHVLEILDERQPVDDRLTQLTGRARDLARRRTEAVRELQTAESRLDAEVAEAEGRRTEAAARIPAALLATYDQLRARLGGVAVSRLVGSRCDGCHLTLPATELDRIRHLPPGEVVTCDQCGRILVYG